MTLRLTFVHSNFQENIKIDEETGEVEWIDPRAGNLKYMFKKMRPSDPLHQLGDAPLPDESLEPAGTQLRRSRTVPLPQRHPQKVTTCSAKNEDDLCEMFA